MEKYVSWQLLQTHSVSWDTHKTNSQWKYHSLKHVRYLVREEMAQYFPWQGTWHLFGGMRVVKWDCGLRGRGCDHWSQRWPSVVHSFPCVPATPPAMRWGLFPSHTDSGLYPILATMLQVETFFFFPHFDWAPWDSFSGFSHYFAKNST